MEQVVRDLMRIKQGLRNKLIRKALAPASSKLNKELKANAPVGKTKALKASIGQKLIVKGDRASAIIGVRSRWSKKTKEGLKVPQKYGKQRYPELAHVDLGSARASVLAVVQEQLDLLAKGA